MLKNYPRPQLRRNSFINLNGEWSFSVMEDKGPETKIGTICVPYAPEAPLSGIGRTFANNSLMHYSRSFSLPEGFNKGRVLLHFGAVDQQAQVYVNGVSAGSHTGGYEHFFFDITAFLKDENTIDVYASDDLDSLKLPYGKQKHDRGGIWYTPTSGIWQTVWLESVPEVYIEELKIAASGNRVTVEAVGADEGTVTVSPAKIYGKDGEKGASFTEKLSCGKAEFTVNEPAFWSPEEPWLYDFTVEAGEDRAESYFGLRDIAAGEAGGHPRILLNGAPYYFHGLLDQGYWPDGGLTPPSDEAYEFDILAMKSLGYDTLRKHIKQEPEQFYYDCDRLGMAVFQDMVNNGKVKHFWDGVMATVGLKRRSDRMLHPDRETRKAFLQNMEQEVKALKNHPCICYWTIFNEGWGQFCSTDAYELMRLLDDTRIIDSASGWYKGGKTEVVSEHIYFRPVKLKAADKPLILSEFGGYVYKPEGHVFNEDREYGYRYYKEREAYEEAVLKLYEDEIIPAVEEAGLDCDIYTQVSDVEDELNGYLSYDRQVLKVSPEPMRAMALRLKEAFARSCEGK